MSARTVYICDRCGKEAPDENYLSSWLVVSSREGSFDFCSSGCLIEHLSDPALDPLNQERYMYDGAARARLMARIGIRDIAPDPPDSPAVSPESPVTGLSASSPPANVVDDPDAPFVPGEIVEVHEIDGWLRLPFTRYDKRGLCVVDDVLTYKPRDVRRPKP